MSITSLTSERLTGTRKLGSRIADQFISACEHQQLGSSDKHNAAFLLMCSNRELYSIYAITRRALTDVALVLDEDEIRTIDSLVELCDFLQD